MQSEKKNHLKSFFKKNPSWSKNLELKEYPPAFQQFQLDIQNLYLFNYFGPYSREGLVVFLFHPSSQTTRVLHKPSKEDNFHPAKSKAE